MHVYGNDGQLVQLSPEVRLTRSQLDLLQFPCDPAGAVGLLPGRSLASADEKWNADPWVFPLLTGMDAAISQSVSGTVLELSEQEAKIGFECRGSGAVTGSATEVTLSGTLLFDRKARVIRRFDAVMNENRSAGPVSPGLKVKASISWTQDPAEADAQLSALIPAGFPESGRLLLTLVTGAAARSALACISGDRRSGHSADADERSSDSTMQSGGCAADAGRTIHGGGQVSVGN
jgi:hypothetical protein